MKKMIEESSVRYLGEGLYHGSTRGWIISQIVRKVDSKHRSLGQFIRDEINKPLDVEVYVGLPQEKEPRMIEMMPDPSIGQQLIILAKFLLGRLPPNIQKLTSEILNSDSFINRYAINTISGGVLNVVNTPEFHSIEMSSSNTISNARSLGKIAGLLANGGEIDGVRLLNRKTLDEAIVRDQPRFMDKMLFTNDSWTVGGFGDLSDGFLPMGEGWIGWGGFGGTVIAFNIEKGVGVAYVIRGMMPAYPIDQRHKRIVKTVEACLNKS